MVDRSGRSGGNSLILGVLIGAAIVAAGFVAYLYYQRTHEDVLRINVPGFSGEISKDKGIDIEGGKSR